MTDERIGGNTYENTYETHAHMRRIHTRRREQNRRFGCCSDTHSWFVLLLGAGRLGAGACSAGGALGGALDDGRCRSSRCVSGQSLLVCGSTTGVPAGLAFWRDLTWCSVVPAGHAVAGKVRGRQGGVRSAAVVPPPGHVHRLTHRKTQSDNLCTTRTRESDHAWSTCVHVPAPRTHSKRWAACACCFTLSCVRTGSSACSPGFCHPLQWFPRPGAACRLPIAPLSLPAGHPTSSSLPATLGPRRATRARTRLTRA